LLLAEMRDLERDLIVMSNEWADAERELVHRSRQVERLKATMRLKLRQTTPKPTREDLDALVLDWLWEWHGELMERLVLAEAGVAAHKAVHRCVQPALSSKQSRLNADLKLELGTKTNL